MKRAFLSMLCLVMLSLASAPAGFMPARASDGTLVLKICTGGTGRMMTVEVPLRAADVPVDDEDEGEGCAYGPASGFNPPVPFEFADLLLRASDQSAGLPPALTGIFPPALPPSTGPPLA